jgi:hypothetical protein
MVDPEFIESSLRTVIYSVMGKRRTENMSLTSIPTSRRRRGWAPRTPRSWLVMQNGRGLAEVRDDARVRGRQPAACGWNGFEPVTSYFDLRSRPH